MKPSATLVNIARGGVVDDAALVEVLRNGRIAAAGLDVFESEPSLHPGFLELQNVVLTPHIGSASRATRLAMANRAADNLIAALGGNFQPNLVNPSVRPAVRHCHDRSSRPGSSYDSFHTPISSTSKISVAFGGMTPPAPRAP